MSMSLKKESENNLIIYQLNNDKLIIAVKINELEMQVSTEMITNIEQGKKAGQE